MELPEQLHDLCAAGRIQGAGGFVRQQQLGAAHHGPCNGHTLALAAGQLVRAMVDPIAKPHHLQRRTGPLPALHLFHPAVQQRQGHVIQRRQPGQQVEGLKHEAQFLVPHLRQL